MKAKYFGLVAAFAATVMTAPANAATPIDIKINTTDPFSLPLANVSQVVTLSYSGPAATLDVKVNELVHFIEYQCSYEATGCEAFPLPSSSNPHGYIGPGGSGWDFVTNTVWLSTQDHSSPETVTTWSETFAIDHYVPSDVPGLYGAGSEWVYEFRELVSLDVTPHFADTATAGHFTISGLAPLPEPTTWWLLLAGFATIGLCLRRARQTFAVPQS